MICCYHCFWEHLVHVSSFSISSPIFLIVSITNSSIFSFFDSGRPWISNQFLLDYCYCLSKLPFKDSIIADISLTFFCSPLIIFLALSSSDSSNFSQLKLTVLFTLTLAHFGFYSFTVNALYLFLNILNTGL